MIRRVCPAASIALVIVLASLMTGCGGKDEPTLAPKRVEQEIQNGVSTDLGISLDVECPAGQPLKKGDRFTCFASSADTDDLKIEVRQVNNRGSVRWDAKILATERYETNISQYIQQQRKIKVDVTCPDAVPIKVDGDFVCEARDPKTGETRDIDVTQKDDEGNIEFSS